MFLNVGSCFYSQVLNTSNSDKLDFIKKQQLKIWKKMKGVWILKEYNDVCLIFQVGILLSKEAIITVLGFFLYEIYKLLLTFKK